MGINRILISIIFLFSILVQAANIELCIETLCRKVDVTSHLTYVDLDGRLFGLEGNIEIILIKNTDSIGNGTARLEIPHISINIKNLPLNSQIYVQIRCFDDINNYSIAISTLPYVTISKPGRYILPSCFRATTVNVAVWRGSQYFDFTFMATPRQEIDISVEGYGYNNELAFLTFLSVAVVAAAAFYRYATKNLR